MLERGYEHPSLFASHTRIKQLKGEGELLANN